MEISIFISRCLAYGIQILPIHQRGIIKSSEKYKIPDHILATLPDREFKKYLDALYLTSSEYSIDWLKGFDILTEIGFTAKERRDGHRVFATMCWPGEDEAKE